MTVKMRYSSAMRGITVAAAAAALITAVGGTAVASKIASHEGARHRVTATATAVGPCRDLCGESVSRSAAGVTVQLDNYNAHPVRIEVWVHDPDDTGPVYCPTGVCADVQTFRVAPHSSVTTPLYSWGTATRLSFLFVDHYNDRPLGGVTVEKP